MSDLTRCPSSDCHPGAVLFGIVLPGGRIAFAADRIVVDDQFVTIARQQPRPPEQRFRFSTTCARGACMQWDANLPGTNNQGGCSLIDRLMSAFSQGQDPPATAAATTDAAPTPGPAHSELPDCSIRDECRWFRQRGDSACRICPYVVTDMTASDDDLPPRVRHARLAAHD
ncbi:MAG: hypothetical protein AB7G11_11820 [Phycisphaerales bacterium]